MDKKSKNLPKGRKQHDETARQIRLIHTLAKRLPWIVVLVTLLAAIIFVIQAYFGVLR